MTLEERVESLEKRVAQAELDIVNLAEVIRKFSDGVATLQAVQKETLSVLGRILPMKSNRAQ